MKKILLPLVCMAWLNIAAAQEQTDEVTLPAYPKILVETNVGNFTLELFTSRAPLTVNNFLNYVNNGFYDGTVFHRVVAGFVAQAGGYDANYKRKETGPTIPNESGNGLSNRRGFVAMVGTQDVA